MSLISANRCNSSTIIITSGIIENYNISIHEVGTYSIPGIGELSVNNNTSAEKVMDKHSIFEAFSPEILDHQLTIRPWTMGDSIIPFGRKTVQKAVRIKPGLPGCLVPRWSHDGAARASVSTRIPPIRVEGVTLVGEDKLRATSSQEDCAVEVRRKTKLQQYSEAV